MHIHYIGTTFVHDLCRHAHNTIQAQTRQTRATAQISLFLFFNFIYFFRKGIDRLIRFPIIVMIND